MTNQKFIIFNIDKKEQIYFGDNFGDCFQEAFDFTNHFVRPTVSLPIDPLENVVVSQTALNESSLSRLPPEVLKLIFDVFDEYYDACALALTNTYFWIVGISRLRVLYVDYVKRLTPDWAGDRLVCLGSYTEDLPPNLLTEAETAELKEISLEYSDDGGDDVVWENEGNIPYPFDRFQQISTEAEEGCTKTYGPNSSRRFENEFFWTSGRHRRPLRFPGILEWLEPRGRYPKKRGVPYVLRNLVQRQYVRADTLALNSSDVHGPFIDSLDFGDFLLQKICWSSDDEIHFAYTGQVAGIHRGEWAGNRFDIVLLDCFELEGWEDVTEAASQDLQEIWEEYYGSDWVYKVLERRGNPPWCF